MEKQIQIPLAMLSDQRLDYVDLIVYGASKHLTTQQIATALNKSHHDVQGTIDKLSSLGYTTVQGEERQILRFGLQVRLSTRTQIHNYLCEMRTTQKGQSLAMTVRAPISATEDYADPLWWSDRGKEFAIHAMSMEDYKYEKDCWLHFVAWLRLLKGRSPELFR